MITMIENVIKCPNICFHGQRSHSKQRFCDISKRYMSFRKPDRDEIKLARPGVVKTHKKPLDITEPMVRSDSPPLKTYISMLKTRFYRADMPYRRVSFDGGTHSDRWEVPGSARVGKSDAVTLGI